MSSLKKEFSKEIKIVKQIKHLIYALIEAVGMWKSTQVNSE